MKLFRKAGAQSVKEGSLGNPLQSVGMKLLLIIFSSIVLCVLVMGLYSYNTSKNVIKNKVAGATHQTIVQAMDKLDLVFKGYENLSMQILLDPAINEELDTLVRDKSLQEYERLEMYRSLTGKLDTYIYSNEDVAAIHLYLPSLKKGISAAGMLDEKIENEPWYKETMEKQGAVLWLDTRQEGYIGSLNQTSDTNDSAKFALSRLFKSTSSGIDFGVIIIEFKVDALNRELSKMKLGDGAQLMLINAAGQLMQSESLEKIGQSASVDLKQVKELEEGIGTLRLEQEETLIVHKASEAVKWTMIGTVPVDSLTQDAKVIFNVTLWMSLFAALLALLIGYIVIRMIARPLVQLRNLMKSGEQGDLRARMNAKSGDEIGQLAQSYNRMMDQITSLVKQTNESAQEVFEQAGVLTGASKKTAVSSQEISVATEEIAKGASALAADAESGNDLTYKISGQMKQVIDGNVQMGAAASEVRKASESGIDYMAQVIKKTNVSEEMTRSMAAKVERLNESTKSIRKILEVLNNMAQQTNVLSLNATIEAARAGVAGRGFMVVADEIRKLADQSRHSIELVGQITDTIQKEIAETVEALSQAYPIFQEQIASVKKADAIFNRVNEHMGEFIERLDSVTDSVQQLEQSQAILAEAMSNVSAVSQQSSATSEEVASLSSEQMEVSRSLVSLAENLESLANTLQRSLDRFRIDL